MKKILTEVSLNGGYILHLEGRGFNPIVELNDVRICGSFCIPLESTN